MSDDELHAELVLQLADALTELVPKDHHFYRIEDIAGEVRRRRLRHHKVAGRCTCWICYDAHLATIHDGDVEPF